jgi:hypothetical protein
MDIDAKRAYDLPFGLSEKVRPCSHECAASPAAPSQSQLLGGREPAVCMLLRAEVERVQVEYPILDVMAAISAKVASWCGAVVAKVPHWRGRGGSASSTTTDASQPGVVGGKRVGAAVAAVNDDDSRAAAVAVPMPQERV